MRTALNVARVIHFDLTVTGASAWQWWTAVSEADYKDGLAQARRSGNDLPVAAAVDTRQLQPVCPPWNAPD
jgi:hypothetical protein